MKNDKMKGADPKREERLREQPARSSAFNEHSTKDQKSTRNIEQEAARDQQAVDKGQKPVDSKQ